MLFIYQRAIWVTVYKSRYKRPFDESNSILSYLSLYFTDQKYDSALLFVSNNFFQKFHTVFRSVFKMLIYNSFINILSFANIQGNNFFLVRVRNFCKHVNSVGFWNSSVIC